MKSRSSFVALAFLALVVAGCGTTTAKRAVDPRTEALAFFPSDAQVVALLRTDLGSGHQIALDKAAGGVEPWRALRTAIAGQLRLAGISLAELEPLLHARQEELATSPPQLAVGAPSVADLEAGRPLFVLVTDRAGLMDRIFGAAADAGHLERAGTYHDARLFRDAGAAFATRDGVLVGGHDLAQVRAAISLRDGDPDSQLDDGVVDGYLSDLPDDPPLQIYADLGAIIDADPAIGPLAQRTPWLGAIGHTAVGIRPAGGEMVIDLAARTDRASVPASELPVSETPSRFVFSATQLRRLLGPSAAASPVGSLLLALAPLNGEATSGDEELRAQLTISR